VAKIPYLFRRKNIYYFRARIPFEHQKSFNAREVTRSLKTENQAEAIPLALKFAANFKATLQDIQTGKKYITSYSELIASLDGATVINNAQNNAVAPLSAAFVSAPVVSHIPAQAPLLSVVIGDFLKRYNPDNKATLTKLNANLPILLELIGDKPVNQILQADVNAYFDDVQKLPVRRDAKAFAGMSLREIIALNTGKCISEGTFSSTYRACASIFFNWAIVNYKDQGFPHLSARGAIYHGSRSDGINKQRAMKHDELQILFGHEKMKKYAASSETAHYYWLPLIGLHTGARINEIAQLNPAEDILQDEKTGVWYFHFTDESEAAEGVNKSIKTNSSRRVVPIHSQLLKLGFLDYVEKIKRGGHKIIFPQWTPRNGKASANASKWFKRYLESVNLRDETPGARLSGFHSFRHTFITYALTHKIAGVFQLTGHETESIDGFGKISAVAKGYWTQRTADTILEKQAIIEKFDYDLVFYPSKL
jgi:integrase